MEHIKLSTTISNFFMSEENYERYLKMAKQQLLERCGFEKMNDFDIDYVVRFKKAYWDEMRIAKEIESIRGTKQEPFQEWWQDKPATYSVYRINGEEYSWMQVKQMLNEKKPFDVELQLLTKDEFIKEARFEEINKYSSSIRIMEMPK